MKLLINDLIQKSDAPEPLKNPALTERYLATTSLTITLDAVHTFDSVGIGATDATTFTVNGTPIAIPPIDINGLYLIPEQTTDTIEFVHDGTFIGRFSAGKSHELASGPMREPGLGTTAISRKTLSGQVVAGAGGYTFRVIQVDFNYKITEEIYSEFTAAYPEQISKGFPFFMIFDCEPGFPIERFYGTTDNELIFQSSAMKFKYSRKFKFEEAF